MRKECFPEIDRLFLVRLTSSSALKIRAPRKYIFVAYKLFFPSSTLKQLIFVDPYTTTKLYSFRLARSQISLSYGNCKFEFLLLIKKMKLYNSDSFEFIFIVVGVRNDVTLVLFSCEFFCAQCWNKFVPIVTTNCVLIALISYIMKFYLYFRVNFLYSKAVFH